MKNSIKVIVSLSIIMVFYSHNTSATSEFPSCIQTNNEAILNNMSLQQFNGQDKFIEHPNSFYKRELNSCLNEKMRLQKQLTECRGEEFILEGPLPEGANNITTSANSQSCLQLMNQNPTIASIVIVGTIIFVRKIYITATSFAKGLWNFGKFFYYGY